MYGVANILKAVKCSRVEGPTKAPLKTAKPCFYKYTNCQQLGQMLITVMPFDFAQEICHANVYTPQKVFQLHLPLENPN